MCCSDQGCVTRRKAGARVGLLRCPAAKQASAAIPSGEACETKRGMHPPVHAAALIGARVMWAANRDHPRAELRSGHTCNAHLRPGYSSRGAR